MACLCFVLFGLFYFFLNTSLITVLCAERISIVFLADCHFLIIPPPQWKFADVKNKGVCSQKDKWHCSLTVLFSHFL